MSSFALPLAAKLALVSAAVVGVCAYHRVPCCAFKCHERAAPPAEASADWRLIADCVEVRSASVFAGACHYNGELMTAGGEALLALRVESGTSQGVDLAGVSAAALVASDKNLKLGGERQSIVFVDERANEPQRERVVELLKERAHGDLGEILAVEAVPITVRRDGDAFEVAVGDRIAARGSALPDRACCKMPQQVWYEPIVPLKERIVGLTHEWRVDEPRLRLNFTRAEENSAFLGRLSLFDGSCAAPRAAEQLRTGRVSASAARGRGPRASVSPLRSPW